MGFSEMPSGHVILMMFGWISFILYCQSIRLIARSKKRDTLRGPFFRLVIAQSVAEIVMFLFVEFHARPRKYRFFDIFGPVDDSRWVKAVYFTQTALKNCLYLQYVVMAANRLTVFVFPLRYNELWSSSRIIMNTVSCWIAAFLITAALFLPSSSYFSFVEKGPNMLAMRADETFMMDDALVDLFLSVLCCLLCLFFYSVAFHLSRIRALPPAMKHQQEKAILRCALLTFLPFVPNTIKSCLLYYSSVNKMTSLSLLSTEMWYYTTEVMCMVQPWCLLISCEALRYRILVNCVPKHEQPTQSSHSTSSQRINPIAH